MDSDDNFCESTSEDLRDKNISINEEEVSENINATVDQIPDIIENIEKPISETSNN